MTPRPLSSSADAMHPGDRPDLAKVRSASDQIHLGPGHAGRRTDGRRERAFLRFFAKLPSPPEDPFHPSQQGLPSFTGNLPTSEPERLTRFPRAANAPRSYLTQYRILDLWPPSCPPHPRPRPEIFRQRFPVDYALIRAGREAGQVHRILIVLGRRLPSRVRRRGLSGSGNNQALFTRDV